MCEKVAQQAQAKATGQPGQRVPKSVWYVSAHSSCTQPDTPECCWCIVLPLKVSSGVNRGAAAAGAGERLLDRCQVLRGPQLLLLL